MLDLNDKQINDYLRRCFTAVDGLWFVKLEERLGFDAALEVDNEVWKIMPKIQARALKALGGLGDGMAALCDAFTFKMAVEGFVFETEKAEDGFTVTITKCPWQELLVKSGREHLSEKVGTTICNTDAAAWAAEFGDDIRFALAEQICKGAGNCTLRFSR